MKKVIMYSVLLCSVFFLTGCGSIVNNYIEGATPGATGCSPNAMEISNMQTSFTNVSYRVDCEGKVFFCSANKGTGAVQCTESKK